MIVFSFFLEYFFFHFCFFVFCFFFVFFCPLPRSNHNFLFVLADFALVLSTRGDTTVVGGTCGDSGHDNQRPWGK